MQTLRELEESFSFSNSYDFNTSSSLDSYDLCYSDDDESFIEISLGHADQQYSYLKDDVEFRISFSSSTIPFPNLSLSTHYSDSLITSTTSPSSSTMRFSSDTHWDPTPNSPTATQNFSNDNETKMALPSVLHRFVNAFMSSFAFRPSSQSSTAFQLVPTKRASNIGSIKNGGIMKFLIKLRSLNIGRLVASLNIQSQVKTNIRCQKPFDKWVVAKSNSRERSKTVLDIINMEAIKGVLVAIGVSLGRKDNSKLKSSPNLNTNCASDNSIQAAIAHCKTSFTPN